MNFIAWLCLIKAVPMALAMYHLPSRSVFEAPTALPNNSYFGYSITYYKKQLVISAPAEGNIGEVYLCNIDKPACAKIARKIDRFSPTYDHKYWFGATVRAGPDFIITCAPRYANKIITFKRPGEYGLCYRYNEASSTSFKQLERLGEKNKTNDICCKPVEYAMDSFGWSIDVASDDSVIVGSPAMFTGRAMIYTPGKQAPDLIPYTQDFTPNYNFGYGVASGSFIYENLQFAVSSTYGLIGSGEVHFFEKKRRVGEILFEEDLNTLGTMYGAVLCAAKLNGTNTDLLVGAPAYAGTHEYNVGAVHVYIFNTNGKPPNFKRTIKGQSDGSLFGSAIIALGDLNGDKKDEIAIGAPFDNNGQGAVYVYSGADLMGVKAPTWLQKIDPEPAYATSFGWSLTRLLDYDENGCNELAIGSPYTDKVVLLKCVASITVNVHMEFPNLQNRTQQNKTMFEFKACLVMQYQSLPVNITANIETTVTMNHEDAVLTETADPHSYTFNTSLHTKTLDYCTPIKFTLPRDGNYEKGITYTMSSKLLGNPLNTTNFDGSLVILSDQSDLHETVTISAAECSGAQCQPKFIYEFNSSIPNKGFKLGSSADAYFLIKLTNIGEVAYDACLRVNFKGVKVLKTSSPPCAIEEKTTGDPTVLCKPTTLNNNSIWFSEKIYVGMTELTSLDRSVSVEVLLYNHCKNVTKQYTHKYPVVASPEGVAVKGFTNVGDYVGMSAIEMKEGKTIEHVYEIVNRGKTNWKEIKPVITLEKKPFIKYNEHPVLLFEGSINSACVMIENLEDKMRFTCEIETLNNIKIVIPMDILPNSLDGILKEHGTVTVFSEIKFDLENTHMKTSITTTIYKGVPLWVIVLATFVGLFILLVIAFVLYKCGFLRREKRKKLENLQKSVKRQTIRRSMMMTQDHSEDRTQILGNVIEEDVHNEGLGPI